MLGTIECKSAMDSFRHPAGESLRTRKNVVVVDESAAHRARLEAIVADPEQAAQKRSYLTLKSSTSSTNENHLIYVLENRS